jgi:hypothetical protein
LEDWNKNQEVGGEFRNLEDWNKNQEVGGEFRNLEDWNQEVVSKGQILMGYLTNKK